MTARTWTLEEVAAFAALQGLKEVTPEEVERIAMLATKVARVSAEIPRMPSKGHEPANVFKVPL